MQIAKENPKKPKTQRNWTDHERVNPLWAKQRRMPYRASFNDYKCIIFME